MTKTQKKAATAWSQDRSDAEQFLWHLKPLWREKFVHDHWWKEPQTKPDRQSALWEVLRRHPHGEGLVSGSHGRDPVLMSNLEFFISLNGLKSWPSLLEHNQKSWARFLEDLWPQRGLCSEPADAVDVIGASVYDLNRPRYERMRALARPFYDFTTFGPDAIPDWRSLKKARKIWDAGLSDDAFMSLGRGRVLIGFDPNRPGIEKLVQERVKAVATAARRQSGKPSTPGKSYWPEWLEVITNFEKTELRRNKNEKREDQLFARYRRIIAPWVWPD